MTGLQTITAQTIFLFPALFNSNTLVVQMLGNGLTAHRGIIP